MKTFASYFCGLVATVLLAVGLAGVAGKLDPIMSDHPEVTPEKIAADGTSFCIIPDSPIKVA